jgi:hypothetical protein
VSLEDYLNDPWRGNMHKAYESAWIHMRPAPEFATSDVVMASLYRAVGFEARTEGQVPKEGREFEKRLQPGKKSQQISGQIGLETFRTIVHAVLESPKQPNQSSKRFLQMSPIVPDVALYSGSARLSSNSWKPGALVQHMIDMGSASAEKAESLWTRLFNAMSVNETDDVWARWLQDEFRQRNPDATEWKQAVPHWANELSEKQHAGLHFPARIFVLDLEAALCAKESMTRRQWVSILDAVIRLGTVSHVLWLCSLHERLWQRTIDVLGGVAKASTGAAEISDSIINVDRRMLGYGAVVMPQIRDYASAYLNARLSLNLLLWTLEELGEDLPVLNSATNIEKFLEIIERRRDDVNKGEFLSRRAHLVSLENKTLACKKGIGSNIIEFARYTLGQRQTLKESLRGYDQGYFLRKRGESRSAPWALLLGPVAILAVVHCCLREAAGPRSVRRLCDHLASYGIEVDVDDVAKGELGPVLRMLGLVLDSPDAESGILLIPPFKQ